MPLSIGTRIGSYEILAPLGAGGMGEVCRAHDTDLDRDVAIKVLPPAFAHDPERLARFKHEAKVLALLNHPNIAQIYGIEESSSGPALVMELIRGKTLKGPVPLETALAYARQIADALEAAHEKGIVHRDLKPANIMITPEGIVKVLDFGLAAVAQPTGAWEGYPNNSPTLSFAATQAGNIMGTAAYMSPEQVSGKPVDRRSDIWAFGVVLYELTTGSRLFDRETTSHTLAAVLTKEPDLTQVPAKLRKLLGRCLEKDPKRRLRDIGDAMLLLQEEAPRAEAPRRNAWPWQGVAALFLLTALTIAYLHFRETSAPQVPMRLLVELPADLDIRSFALSPDGRTLVMAAGISGSPSQGLYLRSLDSRELRLISGTDAARVPFWSANGRSIGFFADNKLKIVSAGGGPVRTLCDSGLGGGGTWNRDNVILLGGRGHIERVSAEGGPCTDVSTHESKAGQVFPAFLPDGLHFLYTAPGADESTAGIYLASLDNPAGRRLLADNSSAVYVPALPGAKLAHVVFLREESTLMAQPFDPETRQAVGDAFSVGTRASFTNTAPQVAASASASGILVYAAGRVIDRQLTWFDRSGKALGNVGPRSSNRQAGVSLSPDRKSVAFLRLGTARRSSNGLWLHDMERGVETLFAAISVYSGGPVWSPDGSRIVFGRSKNLYRKDTGGGPEELLVENDNPKTASDWSRDGHILLYTESDPKTGADIWIFPDPYGKPGARKPVPFLQTAFSESEGQFSPDGHFVAYVSNESGLAEVYIRPFPTGDAKWQVSTNGGGEPRWRRDGKELYYVGPGKRRPSMMAVRINPGARAMVSAPETLFEYLYKGFVSQLNIFGYSPSADGQRFLINALAEEPHLTLNVLVNWPEMARKGTPPE